MYVSTLGQAQQTATTQVVYRQPVAPVYYTPGVMFARRTTTGVPGAPYTPQFNPAEVEKAIYKDLPLDTQKEQEVAGTEPQKMIKLKSGLEIPSYIMQRDIARKQAKIRAAEAIASQPLPKFHKIGVYATKKPAQASLMALGLGFICGQIIYSFKH